MKDTSDIYDARNPAHQQELLTANNVDVIWDDEMGWALSWKHGVMSKLSMGDEAEGRAIAALFVHWWLNKNHPQGLTNCGELRDAAWYFFHPEAASS